MSYADLGEIKEHLKTRVALEGGKSDAPAAPWITPYTWRPSKEIPRRKWLYGGHFIREFVTGTFAPGAVGKSILEIAEAMAMASGKPILGVMPTERLRVAYWNGEDPLEETERRVAAVALQFGLTAQDLEGWFYWGSGRESEVVIAEQTRDGTMIIKPNVDRVRELIQAYRLDVAILDPFVSTHRVTENDNNAIDLVAKQWGRLAGETNIACELVHHTTKAAIGRETRAEDGRGGGALLFACRSVRVLNTMSQEEADAAGVPPKFRRYHFRVDNGKANLAPPPDRSSWYRFVSVDLGNEGSILEPGDSVGVPIPWEWPEGAAPVTDGKTGKVSLSLAAQVVMSAFGRLVDEERTFPAPNVPGVRPGTRSVQVKELRNKAIEMGLFSAPKPDRDDEKSVETWQAGARAAWKRGYEAVVKAKLLRVESDFAWELRTNSARGTTRTND